MLSIADFMYNKLSKNNDQCNSLIALSYVVCKTSVEVLEIIHSFLAYIDNVGNVI